VTKNRRFMTVIVRLEIFEMLTNAIVRIEKLVASARHFVQKLCQNFSRYVSNLSDIYTDSIFCHLQR
jgi:hypothetical protein